MARPEAPDYTSLVKDLFDIRGASGVAYRFRRVPAEAALPAMSGNFLYVRQAGDTVEVICSGTADSLGQARVKWAEAVRDHQAEDLIVRLNMSRRVRLEEHADIAALHAPPMVLAEQGDVLDREPT
jgi:hypothetical protein